MNFYYYLFTCAYWASVEDLKEKSAPQEYAFWFVFVVDVLLFVVVTGSINIVAGHNLLSGLMVIFSCSVIALINYLIFLRKKRYTTIIQKFNDLRSPTSKGERIRTMILTFSICGLTAIAVAVLNNEEFRTWLFE